MMWTSTQALQENQDSIVNLLETRLKEYWSSTSIEVGYETLEAWDSTVNHYLYVGRILCTGVEN